MANTKKIIKVKLSPKAKKSVPGKTLGTKKLVVKAVPMEKSEKKELTQHIPVYTITGEKAGIVTAPATIFTGPIVMQLIAQAVRVYLANQREGSASTKTRGQVEGSTRKIYKQKGTGRARHGGIRAPIFVGGGIVFGPHPRDYTLQFPQAMRAAALKSAFALKLKEEAIMVLADIEDKKPNTKILAACLKKLGVTRKTLIIVDDMHAALVKSARNIHDITIIPAQNVTTYDVAMNQKIICTKEALKQLEKRFL